MPEPAEVTLQLQNTFRKTRRWTLFFSMVGFVVTGAFSVISLNAIFRFSGEGWFAWLDLTTLPIVAVAAGVGSWRMLVYSGRISHFLHTGDRGDLYAVFRSEFVLWRFATYITGGAVILLGLQAGFELLRFLLD